MTLTEPLSRRVLADQVQDRILESILSGHYPPDSRIVETQVARELGTSQAPVREALRGLEGLGFVEITPFRGARVRRPSRREIVEAYEVRSALESLAARAAVPRLTDADLAGLAGEVEAMRVAARAGTGMPSPRPTPGSTPRSSSSRTTRRWPRCGVRSSRSCGRTSPSPRPARTPSGRPGCTSRSAAARGARSRRGRRRAPGHFDEVSEHMARHWPDEGAGG